MLEGLLQRLHRLREIAADQRALLAALVAWVPLLVLATDRVSVLRSVAAYGRFLAAVPILVAAERLLVPRIREAAEQVLHGGLLAPEAQAQCAARLESLARKEGRRTTALACLALAYALGLWTASEQAALNFVHWARITAGDSTGLSAAGWWLELVSLPLFWYLLLRHVARFLAWALFVLKVSRLRWVLHATHPDRMGGIAFLAEVQADFGYVLFAVGLALSTAWWQVTAERGMPASAHVQTAAVYIVGATVLPLLPLLAFVPHLRRLRWSGELEYGRLATRYVRAFDRRWLRAEPAPGDQELLGTPDLQSLADLVNSVNAVRAVQRLPITRGAALKLVLLAGLAMVPLALAAAPLDAILHAVLKALL
ncbi:MAG: hypothetical protein QM765_00975 [Myxococcales bacterium]